MILIHLLIIIIIIIIIIVVIIIINKGQEKKGQDPGFQSCDTGVCEKHSSAEEEPWEN